MRGCRPLTIDEFNRLIRTCRQLFHKPAAERNCAMFTVMLTTGLRIGEARMLRVGDVYHNGRIASSLYLERRYSKTKRQGSTLPLPVYTRQALKHWLGFSRLTDRGPQAWLFPACVPGPSDLPLYRTTAVNHRSVRKALHQLKAVLGLTGKVSTHSFRKTFAHRMYELLDHDLFACQAALRHREIGSTLCYLNVRHQAIEHAVLRFFGGPETTPTAAGADQRELALIEPSTWRQAKV